MWYQLKFPYYVSEASAYVGNDLVTLTRKYDFVTYHLTKLIHGPDKLKELSSHYHLAQVVGVDLWGVL